MEFTKPFAGLFIPKNIKPILITNNLSLNKISKISNSFNIFREENLFNFLNYQN